jgi:CRISPR-associated protein Cmr5
VERPAEKRLTRSQEDLLLAERLVTEAAALKGDGYRIYGGLCHSFPVLVQTCGLCQALAFHQSKAAGEGDRAKAHSMLLKHVGVLLHTDGDVLAAVRGASVTEYMLRTLRVLAAWIYFKRFAVSVQQVGRGQAAEEGESHG